jgi:lysophospholipase L1-like esterase
VGYPEALGERLDLSVTNASCPGEASGGFISLTGTDNVCRPYRSAFPLHVVYSTAQLDFAVAFLRAHPRTRLVTLDIGANDLFVLQKQCPPPPGDVTCIQHGLPGLLNTLSANLGTIYGQIRGQAHYHHALVGLTYYVSNYNDPAAVQIIGAINATVARATLAADGKVADGFGAFKAIAAGSGGDSCAAGLLIVTPAGPTPCDIHPSPRGRDALATAVQQALGHEHEGDE